ncbi:MAG: roadblock/LC7 domain-containing protein [Thermoplasmatota archaeon]
MAERERVGSDRRDPRPRAPSATRPRGAAPVAEAERGVDPDLSGPQALSRELHDTLQALQENLPGILGSALVDETGLPLAWDLKGGADPTLLATAGAIISRSSDRTSRALDFGGVRNAVLTAERGTIAIFRVSQRVSLVVLLQSSTNNILVMVEVTKALERLRQVISPGY